MENKVELIDCYVGDERHAQAAWTSTSREITEEKRARIPAFLKMLATEGHTTPFEKSFISFLVTCDTASHIHFLKHRIGVSVNGESARYRELKEDKYYVPADWPEYLQGDLIESTDDALSEYHTVIETLVHDGIDRKRAKESARFLIPYNNQVKLDISFNFQSFMHFQNKRNKPDAQKEIRELAQEMLQLVWDTGKFQHSIHAYGYLLDLTFPE